MSRAAPTLFCTNESRICQEAGISVAVRIQSYRRINPSHDPLDWSWYFEYARASVNNKFENRI